MEVMVIDHFCHEHPLKLTENVGDKEALYCYGCRKPVISESAYVCVHQCSSTRSILHKRCADIPRKIWHPSHPQHSVHLFDCRVSRRVCDLCNIHFQDMLGYRCLTCDFDIDITCEKLDINNLSEEKRPLQHPSHHHPLTLSTKPAFSFYCDGCGTEDWDKAYVWLTCELWLHKTCASLSTILPKSDLHHHPLSLAFNFPIEPRKFMYTCDICFKEFYTTCWVYYCSDCRHFAHVKCATSLNQFPIQDVPEELIRPFILNQVKNFMPGTMENSSLLSKYHEHPLSLVWERPADELMMICDVCVTPIYSLPYYNCASPTCKHFVHATCCLLHETLSYSPDDETLSWSPDDSQLYGDCLPIDGKHELRPYTSSVSEKGLLFCTVCHCPTNGVFYKCQNCELSMDVKCMSLPTIIKHAAHSGHKLIMKRFRGNWKCRGCRHTIENNTAYFCTRDHCDYVLDLVCVLLPKSIKHKWDQHPLTLKFDACEDFCEVCEEELDPYCWRYGCSKCRQSFQTHCVTASGYYKNIKFGNQFEVDHRLHPHPLTYNQVITLNLSCHTCSRVLYMKPGFECTPCDYVVCGRPGCRELDRED